jgi:hypothetical protein
MGVSPWMGRVTDAFLYGARMAGACRAEHTFVMPALVAGIHVFLCGQEKQDVDGRDKPGHDGLG